MTANARGRGILLASLLAGALPAVSQPDLGQTAHRIVEPTNEFRRSQSLGNVTPNPGLTQVRYRVNQQPFALAPHSTRTHRLCRSARMALRLPGQAEPVVVQPGDGDRFVVEAAAPGTIG